MKIEITKETGLIAATIASIVGLVGTAGYAIAKAKSAQAEVDELRDEIREQNDKIARQTDSVNRMCGTIDRSIESLSEGIDVDIPQEIIEKATKAACEREATLAGADVRLDMKETIRAKSEEEVEKIAEKIVPNAETEFRRAYQKKLNSINVQSVKKDIESSVKRELMSQAKADVDRVTSSFVDQVNQQAQFIKAMNDKMTGTTTVA
jgi:hypothetical protein